MEKLRAANMIQAPAPLPGRRDEIKKLTEELGLPE